jgi:hypothetical protein
MVTGRQLGTAIRNSAREGDVVVDTQSLPTWSGPAERLGEGLDAYGERPERVIRFSPPGHFGPSEVVDEGTFEVSSDGFAFTYPFLPPDDAPGVECRYRSHGVTLVRPYTGGIAYVLAEPGS